MSEGNGAALAPMVRLAALVAIDKRIRPALADAKAAAREELISRGGGSLPIEVNGEKVGTVSETRSKARPYIYAERTAEAMAFLRGHGLTDEQPAKGWEDAFARAGSAIVFKETGEVVDWAGWQPESVTGASVRGCKPEDVAAAMGPGAELIDARALIEGEVA